MILRVCGYKLRIGCTRKRLYSTHDHAYEYSNDIELIGCGGQVGADANPYPNNVHEKQGETVAPDARQPREGPGAKCTHQLNNEKNGNEYITFQMQHIRSK